MLNIYSKGPKNLTLDCLNTSHLFRGGDGELPGQLTKTNSVPYFFSYERLLFGNKAHMELNVLSHHAHILKCIGCFLQCHVKKNIYLADPLQWMLPCSCCPL